MREIAAEEGRGILQCCHAIPSAMKTLYRIAVVVFLLAVTTALVGFVIDRYWTNSSLERRAARVPAQSALVDEQPLLTSEQLAPLASTPEEQDFATNALPPCALLHSIPRLFRRRPRHSRRGSRICRSR